jgi:hypothetical protein
MYDKGEKEDKNPRDSAAQIVYRRVSLRINI